VSQIVYLTKILLLYLCLDYRKDVNLHSAVNSFLELEIFVTLVLSAPLSIFEVLNNL